MKSITTGMISMNKKSYILSYCKLSSLLLNKENYLPISSAGNNTPIICEWHDLCLENIVIMTRMEWKFDTLGFPVPQYNPPVIRSWYQNVTICTEAYSVHTASVLIKLCVNTKSKNKILKHKTIARIRLWDLNFESPAI